MVGFNFYIENSPSWIPTYVELFVMHWYNPTLIMRVLLGTQTWTKSFLKKSKLHKTNAFVFAYISETGHSHSSRRRMFRLQQPYRNLNIGKKGLSYIGPRYWNALRSDLKSSKNTNIFKHNMKDEYFNLLTKKENDIYVYY